MEDLTTQANLNQSRFTGAELPSAGVGFSGALGEELAVVALDALLGFADEGAAAVEVDAAGGVRAIEVVEDDGGDRWKAGARFLPPPQPLRGGLTPCALMA